MEKKGWKGSKNRLRIFLIGEAIYDIQKLKLSLGSLWSFILFILNMFDRVKGLL
jgi:hypothetical protein